jgi:hypothetical protein
MEKSSNFWINLESSRHITNPCRISRLLFVIGALVVLVGSIIVASVLFALVPSCVLAASTWISIWILIVLPLSFSRSLIIAIILLLAMVVLIVTLPMIRWIHSVGVKL